MKKILNWTFGSVFRTFGRILAYLLIGILGFIIIQKRDLKITDLLGISYVKADELQNWSSSQSRYRYDDHGTNIYSAWEITPHTWEPTLPVNKMQWRVKSTDGLSDENTYIIKFAYRPIPQAITPTKIQVYADTGTIVYEEITCGQWEYNQDNFNVVKCTFTPKNNINSSTWLIIEVNFRQEYLTSIRSYMNKYEERKSTNAVITEQTIDLINNSNENTQEIINNINQANENLIEGLSEQNQVCSYIDYKFIKTNKKYLNNNGELIDDQNYGVTDYININSTKVEVVDNNQSWTSPNICFYNHNKSLISCTITNSGLGNVMIPNNTYYARFSINSENQKPVYKICKNGNQAVNDGVNDLIHDINNKDTEEALNGFKDFFNLFTNNGHGLTSIITAPLNAINSLTSSTCSPLVLPLPYMNNKNLTLPCMRSIYEEHFGSFMTIYDTITFGIISYWVILKLFKLIKNFKNPEDESIEVVDL